MTGASTRTDTLAYSNCPVPNGLLVARESQLLSAVGIDLAVLGGAQGTLHFTYDHPAYTRFGGEVPPLVSEGLRAPGRTRLLGATVFRGRQGFYSSDPAVSSPADLAGRRVGVSASAIRILRGVLGDYRELDPWRQTLVALGTWEARALQNTLRRSGVTLDQVELVPVEVAGVDLPPDRLAASASVNGADLFPAVGAHQATILAGGEVDALFSWLPWAAELEDLAGVAPLVDLEADAANHYASVWTVSAQLVDEDPELVARLVDTVVQAGTWAREHRAETIGIHARNLGVTEPVVLRGFGADFVDHLVPTLGDDALATLANTQRYLVENNLVDHEIDLERWAAPEFLETSLSSAANGEIE
ncbi:MAG: 2'-hydroxybiphenyl-2-sulfinate desulfinase [Gordonia polyisoprenivorans]|nr:2'-hydroxybiphenyl-2-sulfinate desulfinase [Gordonia polyisoprenivorans]